LAVPQEFVALNAIAFDVKAFDCGKPDMNQFLARHAAKHMAQGLSSSWVLPAELPKEGEKTPIAAYYTLAMATVVKDDVPTEAGLGSLPGYPVPVVKLARLAVSVHLQGQRYGEKTLIYALRHAAKMTAPGAGLPAAALVLDILDADAKGFYDKFEFFHELGGDPMKLFVPMRVCREL
jgi:hypothetical protein